MCVDLPQTDYNVVSKEKIPQCYYPAEYKELVRLLFCDGLDLLLIFPKEQNHDLGLRITQEEWFEDLWRCINTKLL